MRSVSVILRRREPRSLGVSDQNVEVPVAGVRLQGGLGRWSGVGDQWEDMVDRSLPTPRQVTAGQVGPKQPVFFLPLHIIFTRDIFVSYLYSSTMLVLRTMCVGGGVGYKSIDQERDPTQC